MAQPRLITDPYRRPYNEPYSSASRSPELVPPTSVSRDIHAYQAYQILHVGFVAVPLIAGLDKFANLLAQWDLYLAPVIPQTLGIEGPTFMKVIGAIEIIAALGVAFKPKLFAYVVSAWLLGIVGNLLIAGQFFDVALRDLGLAVGAYALGRLSEDYSGDKRVRV